MRETVPQGADGDATGERRPYPRMVGQEPPEELENGPPLGTSGNLLPRDPPSPVPEASARVKTRAIRYALARFLWTRSGLKSVRLCRVPVSDVVRVGIHGSDFIAHISGVARCSSPWSCPLCAPRVRQGRAEEIEQGLRFALDTGMSALFISTTLQHGSRDPLAQTFDLLRRGHRLIHSGKHWKALHQSLDYAGAIRAWEITHGRNGFHPHSHELALFEGQVSDDQIRALEDHYTRVYGRFLAKHGLYLHPVHGIDVRRVQSAGDLAGYLTKMDDSTWGAGLELARQDLKTGKRQSQTPFELLADATDGDLRAWALWREYEDATKGKRAISWSRGLKARLLVATDDQGATDEDLAALAPDADEVWGIDLPPKTWAAVRMAGGIAELITMCEQEARSGQKETADAE